MSIVAQVMLSWEWLTLSIIAKSELGSNLDCSVINSRSELGSDLDCYELRCCVLGQGTSPSNASFDSGENEYLVGQRWQCVR